MRILTRYLYQSILLYFAIFMGLFMVVLLVSELFDAKSLIIENSTRLGVVFEYLIYSIPLQLAQVMPLISLMTTIFAFGILAKNREILAMVAAGVSFRSLAVPAISFGVLLSLFLFWFDENVVPQAQLQAEAIEKLGLAGKDASIFTKRDDLFVKGNGNRFYLMQEFRSDTNEMIYPTILVTSDSGGRVTDRIEAVVAQLKGGFWEFQGAEHWTFNEDGSLATYDRFPGVYRLKMEDQLDKFLSKTKKPEEMSFMELLEYVHLQIDKGGQDVLRFRLDLQHKLSFPLACLLMAALGFSVVVDVHARHFARGVLVGLVVAIAYYVLDSLLRNMGIRGGLPWLPAAWGPSVLFIATLAVLMNRLERIRH